MSGRRVPKGWRVQLMMGNAQRNIQEFQEDEDQFRPERCPASGGPADVIRA